MSQVSTFLPKIFPHREMPCKPASSVLTTFETSNRYVQSNLAYDVFRAVENGSLTLVRNVLLSRPDLDLNFHIKDVTPLSLALYKRHFDIFNMLIRHQEKTRRVDLDVSSKDTLGRVEPPIITACRMHFLEGVFTLVGAGADINSVDNLGHTALWVAARRQMPDLVDYLIMNGASVNKVNKFQYTPLLASLMYHVSSIIVKMLIVNGSNLGPHSPIEHCALFWAAKRGNIEIVRLVIAAGVPLSQIRAVKMALMNSDIDPEITTLLDIDSRTPPTLQHQCKRIIRTYIANKSMGIYFTKHIDGLPLPSSLKNYLALVR
ncbi:putative ankyrin repeat protein RF_0381 [Patella vulgata]|uniref:putative ankyrin repeat protein RF_0381 n=1 Tax=Patella vulgata TaxID=6465 RepID=UPI00217FB2A6|nr:putative ankyrin repeat protein RF_0381 [Patella vulgata]XP_050390905.1 putative ankyrin repeat protein RF_0381 [Patella vulgata]